MQNYNYFTFLSLNKVKMFFALFLFTFTAIASFGQIQGVLASTEIPTWTCDPIHVTGGEEYTTYTGHDGRSLWSTIEDCRVEVDKKVQNYANQFGLFIMSSPTQICPSGYNDCYCPSTVTNGQAKTISQGRTCGASISVNTNQTTQTIENARYCFIIDNEQCQQYKFVRLIHDKSSINFVGTSSSYNIISRNSSVCSETLS